MNLRNVAIIAHVDHGKTTLVDQLLAQSGVFRANEATTERAMDSNDQERERGITILAKATSVLWNGKAGETRIQLNCPSRALIGYQGEFLTDTRGSGVLNRVFSHYEPHKGAIEGRLKGVLVSNGDGETAAFALWNLEERGVMFVGAGEKTYQGMIIGENSRWDDLDVNPMKAKQLNNIRAAGKDEAVRLTPPRRPSLEQAIAYIEEDELVEVTPKSIRLRKQVLNPSFRKKRVRED